MPIPTPLQATRVISRSSEPDTQNYTRFPGGSVEGPHEDFLARNQGVGDGSKGRWG